MTIDTFPARLRSLRERAGLTVAELAERAQLGRTHVYNLESGVRGRAPAWETIRRLAAALGCAPADLAPPV